MGCACSLPSVIDFEKRECSGKSLDSTYASSKSMFRRKQREQESDSWQGAMSVVEVVERCQDVVQKSFTGAVDVTTAASIVLMESSGIPDLKKFREDFNESAYGLGQMLFSTAEFLMSRGYVEHRVEKPEDLFDPSIALYFVCAYIDLLSKHKTAGKCEELIVKGYHNGSCHLDQVPAEVWDVYSKARTQLLKLKAAMELPPAEQMIYVVQQGENVEIIARICGVSTEAIMDVNPDVKERDAIQAGDCIEIPVKKLLPRLYAVKQNESVAAIARKHDVSLLRLYGANADLKAASALKPGWVLTIPGLKGGNAADGRLPNDLISVGIEDGPFCPSSFAEHYALRMEGDTISGTMIRERLRSSSYGRSVMRRLLKRSMPK